MAEKTEDELRDQYEEIRDETLISANTATRVGQAMLDGLDSYQLKADLPSGLPDGGTGGQFLQRQLLGIPLRFPRKVATTDGVNWIVGNGPPDFSGWDPTWQDSSGIAQGTLGSDIFENSNFPAPDDSNYVTSFVIYEPISGKTFAILSTKAFNSVYIAEITSLNPPTLGPVNQLVNSSLNGSSDVSAYTVSDGYIWIATSGGATTLQVDPNSPTFWQAIDETSFGPSPIRVLYYDTNVAKYGDGFKRLWNVSKSNGFTRYSEQDFDTFEFVAQPPTGNWTSFYAGLSADDANGRIYTTVRSSINGNYHFLRFDMEPEFTNQVSVEVAANTSLDPIDCIWDPTTNKVIGYYIDNSDYNPTYGYRGKLYIATDNGGSFSSVTEVLLPLEVGTPAGGTWLTQPQLTIIGDQLYIPVSGAFNGYSPTEPFGYVLRMDLTTNALTLMTRTPTAGWASVINGDLASDSGGLTRVRGLTDDSGNSYPISGSFSTGTNAGFLRFNGSNFQTQVVDVPAEPFNIIETPSDMTSFFGSPSGGFYNISASTEDGVYYVKGEVDLGSNGLSMSGTQNFSRLSFISGTGKGYIESGFRFNKTSGAGAIICQASTAMEFRDIGLYQAGSNVPLFYTISAPSNTGLTIASCTLQAAASTIVARRTGSSAISLNVFDCDIYSTTSSSYPTVELEGQLKAFIERNRFIADFRFDIVIRNNTASIIDGGGVVKILHNNWLEGASYSWSPVRFFGTGTNFLRELDVSHNTWSIPSLNGSFGSGSDTEFCKFSGNADTVRSLICIGNTAYVNVGTGISMFGFAGGSNVARRAVFIANGIQSNSGTPNMFDVSYNRSDWEVKSNIVNDSFIGTGSGLTPPVNPTDDGKVALASGGDLVYQNIALNTVLGKRIGDSAPLDIKVDDFVSAFYDFPNNQAAQRALFSSAIPVFPTTVTDLVNGGSSVTDTSANADRWYRVEATVLFKEEVTGIPHKIHRVCEYQATSGGVIVQQPTDVVTGGGVTISFALIASNLRTTVTNSTGNIVNGWIWRKTFQYVAYNTLPV